MVVVTASVGVAATSVGGARRTVEGTTVGGLAAGGLDRAELRSLIADAAATSDQLTVTAGRTTRVVARTSAGLAVDVDATADRVLGVAGGGRWAGLRPDPQARAVAPVLRREEQPLARAVTEVVLAARVEESHGDLGWQQGRLVVVPPASGQRLDPADVERALVEAASQLASATAVDVAVLPVPAHLTPGDLEAVASRARTALGPGVALRAGSRRASVKAGEVGPLLTLSAPVGPAPHGVELALRSKAAEGLVARLARSLSVAAVEPALAAPAPTPLLSTQGDVTSRPVKAPVRLRGAGRPGQVVSAAAVSEALTAGLRAGVRAGALPVASRPLPPSSTDAQAARVDAVLGSFTTSFACCAPRVVNIRRIAATVDGTLVGPGRSFSLNGLVGPRTRAKGYVDAPFISDGELSTDVGGGVSQFATTLYNAAFFAGLQLDAAQPHSFYISRYPAGREATVNFPGIDLRFTNDSAGPVLVRTATTATSVTVTLYGVADGRTVRAVTGPRRSVAGRDFRVTVTRIVDRPGRPTLTRSRTTTYNRAPDS